MFYPLSHKIGPVNTTQLKKRAVLQSMDKVSTAHSWKMNYFHSAKYRQEGTLSQNMWD